MHMCVVMHIQHMYRISRNKLRLLICYPAPVRQSIRRVAAATSVLCMHTKWTRKISHTSDLLERTHLTSHVV